MSFIYLDDGSGIGRIIQAFCTLYIGVFLFMKRKHFLKKRYRLINSVVVINAIFICISSYFHGASMFLSQSELSSPILGYMAAVASVLLVFFMEYTNSIGKQYQFISILYYILFGYLVIADIDLLIHPSVEDNTMVAPFVAMMGGKFSLSYKHVAWTLLYALKRTPIKKLHSFSYYKSLGIWAHVLVSFMISILAQCTTAMLGVLFVMLLLASRKRLMKLILKPVNLIIILLVVDSFFIFSMTLVQNQYVQYFLVDVLGKDSSLTGRIDIYEQVYQVLALTPFWGFGPGNSWRVTRLLIDAANTQNGLLELYITYGSLYVISFFVILYVLISKVQLKYLAYPIMLYVYFLVFISCVEVSLGGLMPYASILLLFWGKDTMAEVKTRRNHRRRLVGHLVKI